MPKKYIYAAIILVFFGLILFHWNFRIVSIGRKTFFTQLAKSQEERERGLGKRKSLCQKCAMLFEFKDKKKHAFWMKDMNFDLDIIWISDEKIVFIKKNFSYQSLEVISPPVEADEVLEINAGLSEKYDFKLGQKVKIY